MPDSTTHVLMVIDQSGSMEALTTDVRGGFNGYIDALAGDTCQYRVTVALFDSVYATLCTDVPPADVPRLTTSNYQPTRLTALLDAVGRTIHTFEQRVPELADGDRVLLVVQTDGHENASSDYSYRQIADMIRDRESAGRWSCVYLGQHADAWGQAGRMGFARGQTMSVPHTTTGTATSYTGLSHATTAYATGASAAASSDVLRSFVDPTSGTDQT